ncbi:hypothetical protein B0T18DRAFT_5877 [Schizothecium vesticola]|uniref:Synaptobrevin n=1 Tax=Schizothecium vesticola TaxID=314040 RepID=A0AA40F8I9_9PEZI|nr:hypothetical protein B0T18DRAFT_5877 [Schizothecium vesticola]
MARLIHGVATPAPMPRQADPLTDLNRLLYRLQQSILRADADREARLRADEFEREKVQTNIRYAQSLLTKLEQEALSIKIHARRQDLQTSLVQKREALEQLVDRMNDLAEIASASADSDHDTSEGEDVLAAIIATPSESLDSSRSPDVESSSSEDEPTTAPIPEPVLSLPQPRKTLPSEEFNEKTDPSPPPPTSTTQTLRPRGSHPPSEKDTAHTTARTALFGDRAATAHTPTATAEAILDHQREEQDLLSESILKLAGDLKASSLAFTATLEEDREVVDRAGQGMSKTGEGMDAVTKKVGTLQRMTEGEGWWGRMRLYAQVYGLMVVLVLVVFVLPKLRF